VMEEVRQEWHARVEKTVSPLSRRPSG
jgi:hypothetical protein